MKLSNHTASLAAKALLISLSISNSYAQSIEGDDNDNSLTGTEQNDTIKGHGGNDTLTGLAGNDVLDGGSGNDTASYAGNDGSVQVNLSLTGFQDTLGAGLDSLISIENLIGTGFDDTLYGNNEANILDGGDGRTVFSDGFIPFPSFIKDSNVLYGYGGNDTLLSGQGDDRLYGGTGDDWLMAGLGDDIINGGSGSDTAVYSSGYDLTVDLNLSGYQNVSSKDRDQLVSIENVVGGSGDDVLIGDYRANRLEGGEGSDTLIGNDGDDTLIGGAGSDILDGGNGSDTLSGGSGNDTFRTGAGMDFVDGGTGIDLVDYSDAGGAVVVNLQTGTTSGADQDSLIAIEGVAGSDYSDILVGNAQSNRMRGGLGDDQLFGGEGNDTLDYSQATSGVEVSLANNSANTSQGFDRYYDFENLQGSAHDDTLSGDENSNFLFGGSGHDFLRGQGGDDVLYGGTGNDVLWGEEGRDFLYGEEGNDFLLASAGDDHLDGGEGTDTVSYISHSAGVNIDLKKTSQVTSQGTDLLYDIENIQGSQYDDEIIGDQEDNVLTGEGGNDILIGGGGDDYLSGGEGDDYLRSGPLRGEGFFSFRLQSSAQVALEGGEGDDILEARLVNGVLNGGEGVDTAIIERGGVSIFDTAERGVVVNLANTQTVQSGFQFIGIENLTTGNADDQVAGDGKDNILDSRGGDDYLTGYDGNDTLIGGEGNDVLSGDNDNDLLLGGGGDDFLYGGNGIDTASYQDSSNAVRVDLRISGAQQTDKTFVEPPPGECESDLPPDYCFGGPANAVSVHSVQAAENVAPSATSSGFDLLSSIENLIGSDYDDELTGNENNNVLDGGSGNDLLFGFGGNDTLIGGEGSDELVGGDGNDVLMGGAGNDTLSGGGGTDLADYSDASGPVYANLQIGTVSGSAGFDRLYGIENVSGSAHNDNITGNNFNNVIYGGGGNDQLNGGAGSDTLYGQEGNDTFIAGVGRGVLDGGSGEDTVSYVLDNSGVNVNLGSGAVGSAFHGNATDTLISIENATGSNHDDSLIGNEQNNKLNGLGGNDRLFGLAGNDDLLGGYGDDYLRGGEGDDSIDGGEGIDTASYSDAASRVVVSLRTNQPQDTLGAGVDTLINVENLEGSSYSDTLRGNNLDNVIHGGAGNDAIRGEDGDDILNGGRGVNIINGGSGSDTATYEDAGAGVTVDLSRNNSRQFVGAGRFDTLTSIENLTGSAFDDNLKGDSSDNVLQGGEGNDTLSAISGQNQLFGEAGNDTLVSGTGDDLLDGGSGINTVSYSQASGGVNVNLLIRSAQDTGAAGSDTLVNIRNLTGSSHDDSLTGDHTHNEISGEQGNDTLRGLNGNDTLIGGEGDDLLIGGVGSDRLEGGAGFDTASYIDISTGVDVNLSVQYQSGVPGGADTLNSIEGVIGSNYHDELTGNVVGNTLEGRFGNDILRGLGGNDLLIGGGGNDVIDGGSGIDTASYADAGGAITVDLNQQGIQDTLASGHDQLTGIENLVGSDFDDQLRGDSQSNVLNGGEGADTLNGGNGNDILIGGRGNDRLVGGSGADTVDYSGATGTVTVNLLGGFTSGSDGTDQLFGIENVRGSAFNDTLHGNGYNNVIYAGEGNDHLIGNGGYDTLYGEAGDDSFTAGQGRVVMDGGEGNDTVYYVYQNAGVNVNLSSGVGYHSGVYDTLRSIENISGSFYADTLTGDDGDNVLRGNNGDDLLIGRGGDDVIDGGSGIDTASYQDSSSRVIVDLSFSQRQNTLGAGNDTLIGIENLIGTSFNDQLRGSDEANKLVGRGGNDFLLGRDGDDVLSGGEGNDILAGGAGIDTADYSEAAQSITVDLRRTDAQTTGQGSDTLSGIENLAGSDFSDNLTGNNLNNILAGGAGDDTLTGAGGVDVLIGGEGDDTYIWDNQLANDSTVEDTSGYDTLVWLKELSGQDLRLELTSETNLTVKLDDDNQILIKNQYSSMPDIPVPLGITTVSSDAAGNSGQQSRAIEELISVQGQYNADLDMTFDELITSGQFAEMGIYSQITVNNYLINHNLLDLGSRLINNGIVENRRTLRLNHDGEFQNNGELIVDGEIDNNGTIINSDSGSIVFNGSHAIGGNLINNGIIRVPPSEMMAFTGSLSGSGRFTGDLMLQGASVNPGNSPGLLTFDDTTWSDVDLTMEITGFGRGTQYDAIDILGDLTLENMFSLTLDWSGIPSLDDLLGFEFEFLNVAGNILNSSSQPITGLSDWLPVLDDGWFANWVQDSQGWRLLVSYGGAADSQDVSAPATLSLLLFGTFVAIRMRMKRKH